VLIHATLPLPTPAADGGSRVCNPLATYTGNPAQNAQDYSNSKSETRISKQSENPNVEKFKPSASGLLLFVFSALSLFRISDFEIRVSRRSLWYRLRRVGLQIATNGHIGGASKG
jgi:hypothetical protein